jgi:putative glutamine amidotransferase
MDHSSPMVASREVRIGKAHSIRVTPGGWLHRLAGTTEIAVNSLHNQGVDKLAPGVRVEGTAPDGTIEAVHVISFGGVPVPGFAVGIQWHPENDWQTDIVSRRIFEDFAAAVHAYAANGGIVEVSAAAD